MLTPSFIAAQTCALLILIVGCSYFVPSPQPAPVATVFSTSTPQQSVNETRGSTALTNTPADALANAPRGPTLTTEAALKATAIIASPTSIATLTRTPTSTPTRTATPAPTKTLIPAGPITRIDTQFHSAALDLNRRIIIYLPPGYHQSPQRRYPVLYMLHGYGGFVDPSPEWEQWGLKDIAESMMVKLQIQPMIIVQPNGFTLDGQPSFFFNHAPSVGGKLWGDYIWRDTVSYIGANYRTLATRSSRAIGGFSLGGQGALSLALTHPEVFSIVGGHSPSFRGADGSIPVINDWNHYNQYDPIYLTQNTSGPAQLAIWLDVATGDDKVRNCGPESDRCVQAYHALLAARGIPHEWHDTWPGPHEGVYWSAHLPDYLAWYSSKLVGQ